MMVVFCIATGVSYAYATKHLGLQLNKNTWTRFVKLMGLIAGEFLEGNRQDPENKWMKAQFDETMFGKRLVILENRLILG